MKDLVVLVADNNMKAGIEGALKRHRAHCRNSCMGKHKPNTVSISLPKKER
jgi:hypothetical protein